LVLLTTLTVDFLPSLPGMQPDAPATAAAATTIAMNVLVVFMAIT
jgi:hypothetical protein